MAKTLSLKLKKKGDEAAPAAAPGAAPAAQGGAGGITLELRGADITIEEVIIKPTEAKAKSKKKKK